MIRLRPSPAKFAAEPVGLELNHSWDLDLPAKARVIEGTVQPCDVANFGPVMHRWEPEV